MIVNIPKILNSINYGKLDKRTFYLSFFFASSFDATEHITNHGTLCNFIMKKNGQNLIMC